MGNISCAGRVFVVVAVYKNKNSKNLGVAEAGTSGVSVVVVDVVAPLEAVSFRPRGKLRGWGEFGAAVGTGGRAVDKRGTKFAGSRGEFDLPGREAGLLANAERSSAISWVSQS